MGFLAQLYKSDSSEYDYSFRSFFKGLLKISEEATEELEAPLTSKEVYTALQGMQGGGGRWELMISSLNFIKFSELSWMGTHCRGLFLPQRAVIILLPNKGDLQDVKKLETSPTTVHKL